MTIAGAIYREGIAFSPDGAMYVALPSGSTIPSPTFTGVVTGGGRLLAASGASVSNGANTNEEILGSVTLPVLAANDVLRISATWTFTSSANNKTPRIRLNGIGGTELYGPVKTTTASQSITMTLRNRNATNSQVFMYWAIDSSGAQTGAAAGVASVQTGSAVDLVFTGQKASAGETLSLIAFAVELLRP